MIKLKRSIPCPETLRRRGSSTSPQCAVCGSSRRPPSRAAWSGSSRICRTAMSASRPTSRLPMRSCQPIARAALTVQLRDDLHRGSNLTAKTWSASSANRRRRRSPAALKRPCRSELIISGTKPSPIAPRDEIEIEVAAGVADVEDHAALFGFAHFGKSLPCSSMIDGFCGV